MQERFGLAPGYRTRGPGRDRYVANTSAAAQLLATPPSRGSVEPLPPGKPGIVDGAALGITGDGSCFLVMGDSGGIVNDLPQNAVAQAMVQATAGSGSDVGFVYSVGDIVYYNGDPQQYLPQFYEPYAHLNVPIVGIPGNHDGDSSDGVPGSGIATFMENFCSATPRPPAVDPQLEFGRKTMTQPYCDWGLVLPKVTILGVWDNVPSGGTLAQSQLQWLIQAIKDAPTDRPLIVAAHHPVFSVDSHHGGSPYMKGALDGVFKAAGRLPQAVIGGHVHNYQRFTRTDLGQPIIYIVQGNSGYRNRHPISADAHDGMEVAPGVTLDYADASEYGFLAVSIVGMEVHGVYNGVTDGGAANLPPQITPRKDTF